MESVFSLDLVIYRALGEFNLLVSFFSSSGTISSEGASECSGCAKGFFGASIASDICTACTAGKYAAVVKAANCTACLAGKSQSATGQDSCDYCAAGFYSASDGEGKRRTKSASLYVSV